MFFTTFSFWEFLAPKCPPGFISTQFAIEIKCFFNNFLWISDWFCLAFSDVCGGLAERVYNRLQWFLPWTRPADRSSSRQKSLQPVCVCIATPIKTNNIYTLLLGPAYASASASISKHAMIFALSSTCWKNNFQPYPFGSHDPYPIWIPIKIWPTLKHNHVFYKFGTPFGIPFGTHWGALDHIFEIKIFLIAFLSSRNKGKIR